MHRDSKDKLPRCSTRGPIKSALFTTSRRVKGPSLLTYEPGSLFGLQPLETPAFPKPLPQATPWLPPKHLRSSYSEMWVKLALGKKGRSQPIHFSKINMASVGLNEPGRPPALSMTNGATSEAKPIWARITWPAHTAYTHTWYSTHWCWYTSYVCICML